MKVSTSTIYEHIIEYNISIRPTPVGDKNPRWKGRKIITCPTCNIEKEVPLNSTLIYCSRMCSVLNNKGEGHYKYNGGQIIASHRYWKKIKSDPKLLLTRSVRSAVLRDLKRGKMGKRTEEILGYTFNKLYDWLNDRMSNGYTWNDYLTGKLHLDHIVPISYFNFKTYKDTEFKKCWSIYNLRLLPAKENLEKWNKVTYKDVENLNRKYKLQNLLDFTKLSRKLELA